MPSSSIGSRIGAGFNHIRTHTLLWFCIFAAIGLVCGWVRYSDGAPSHWGDVMAFSWMAAAMMIIIRAENGQRDLELGTARNV